MRRLVVILALALSGCATAKGELCLFNCAPKAPSFQTVLDYVALGDEAGARHWLSEKNVDSADADELIVRAKRQIERQRAECAGLPVCP